MDDAPYGSNDFDVDLPAGPDHHDGLRPGTRS